MPLSYFKNIPYIAYDVAGTGEFRSAIDIFQRTRIKEFFQNGALVYVAYSVKDNETPEVIAHKYYGWIGFHWLVLFANNMFDPYYDWPLSQWNFEQTIIKRYTTLTTNGMEYAQRNVHHYEDQWGNVIDYQTYLNTPDSERSAITIHDYELAINEAKRNIKLIDKQYKDQVAQELQTLMQTNPLQ